MKIYNTDYTADTSLLEEMDSKLSKKSMSLEKFEQEKVFP